jgi:hypothetical protein
MAHDRPRSLIRPGRISDYKVKRKKLQHSISRFHEFVLGDATRGILEGMTVPTLMSYLSAESAVNRSVDGEDHMEHQQNAVQCNSSIPRYHCNHGKRCHCEGCSDW